jgi:hypothetical protein
LFAHIVILLRFIMFVKLYLDSFWFSDEGDAVTFPVERVDFLVMSCRPGYGDLSGRYQLVNPSPGIVGIHGDILDKEFLFHIVNLTLFV